MRIVVIRAKLDAVLVPGQREYEIVGIAQDARYLTSRLDKPIPPDGPNREAWDNEIHKRFNELFDLGKEKQEPQVALNLVPHVYAASLSAARGQPAWISQPPNDENNLYFIGVGGDTLLEKAKQLAHDDAVARRGSGAVFVGRSAGVFANRRSRRWRWKATAPPPGVRLAGVRLDTGPRIPSEPAGWLRTPFD